MKKTFTQDKKNIEKVKKELLKLKNIQSFIINEKNYLTNYPTTFNFE